ncbi:MAG: ATP-binding protein [Mycolicibacterium rufum]|nr:ATP-binding protein [Mycolicibacterium rufum]
MASTTHVGHLIIPSTENYPGIPLGKDARQSTGSTARDRGVGHDDLYALQEQPEVGMRVAAFVKRALHRDIELRETSGFLDPYVSLGSSTPYSLLREEGHGLRELIILLTAVFREDWDLIVVDEPEVHLHPSMARLWLGELERVCRDSGRRAIIVTHEPSLVRPTMAADLRSLYYFRAGHAAQPLADFIDATSRDRVTSSLSENPELVSKLVFSPRPVLVEGPTDVAGLTVALNRTEPPEVVAQTDLVPCGGSSEVALWFEIATHAGMDVRAIADLDACLTSEVQRVMDRNERVIERYRDDFALEPARTASVIRPLLEAMNKAGIAPNPKERAQWLATDVPVASGWAARKSKLLEMWRDAGLWLHPQGTLEAVLGNVAKHRDQIMAAAAQPGAIDAVAQWCAYDVDPSGELAVLLGVFVERAAHSVMEALRLNPEAPVTCFTGPTASHTARLLTLTPEANDVFLLTVQRPKEFEGYWLRFSRDTPSSQLHLEQPQAHGEKLSGQAHRHGRRDRAARADD